MDFLIVKIIYVVYGHMESIAIVVIGTGHIIHFLRDLTAAAQRRRGWFDALIDALKNIAE